MQRRNEIIAGEVGHTKIKRDYGMFSLYKLHEGESNYRKIMESTDYEVLRPHRHEHRKKYSYTPPPPVTVEQSRAMQIKAKKGKPQVKAERPKQMLPIGHVKVKVAREAYHVLMHIGSNQYKKIKTLYKFSDTLPYRNNKMMTHNGKIKYRDFPEPVPKVKPIPLPKTKPAPKVVQTMEATLKAKDKLLERIARTDKLVIAEQSRPQKVRVVVNSKTSIMVYPNEVENAIQRYNQRYKQSQEQSHIHQRKPVAKPKQKQVQSDLIFFH
jgi:sRNA-binding carbon storage regulator CsrA